AATHSATSSAHSSVNPCWLSWWASWMPVFRAPNGAAHRAAKDGTDMELFSSKPPAEPRREYLQCRHGDYPEGDGRDYCVICSPVWIEHPHVQHNKPNPILVAFRDSKHSAGHFLWIAGSPASTEVRWGVQESIHARRVLTR